MFVDCLKLIESFIPWFKENFKLKNILNSFKPLVGGLYLKKEEENNILL